MKTRYSAADDRRGVLLLLVLSSLTLFMMLGAIMLVLATRARTASRAFAAASNTVSRDETRGREALDEALMMLLRGPLPTMAGGPISESILADRYGTVVTMGQVTNLTQVNSGTLRATLSGVNAATPLALNGRVLTIKPQAGDPAPVASYRIIDFSSNVATLANLRGAQPFQQRPSMFPCPAIINGRDYDNSAGNEPWDEADAANPFLTAAQLQGSDMAISRPAFGAVSGSCTVDNDADGVADGTWLSNVLPAQPQENGGSLTFRVSYLVLDMDGRFNVNAHGIPPAATVTGTGPANVDGSASFASGAWNRLMIGGSAATPSASSAQQRRPAPALGTGYSVNGRLGALAGTTNPYTLRLDFNGPRPSVPTLAGERGTPGSIASLFTPGELERVLRPFDADSGALPPRLAAILGDDAQKARMLVTTDAWDTTGLIGQAASKVAIVTATTGLPQEVIEGRRFNVNSGSMATDAAKQAYFSDLCAVLIAAGVSHEKTAQWAANVVEFRDTGTQTSTLTVPGFVATACTIDGVPPPPAVTGNEAAEFTSLGGNTAQEQFGSVGQLLCVPRGSQQELADPNLDPEKKKELRRSLAVDYPVILDALNVPSPFAGTLAANPWREPGRVNVNTSDDAVWKATIGENVTNPYSPAQSAGTMLTNASFMFTDADRPYTAVRTTRANRVASIASTRSNVFAVWLTVEMSDSGAPDQPKQYRRLFAIVDRSIPVGYCPGVDLNARDAVRLIRYLD